MPVQYQRKGHSNEGVTRIRLPHARSFRTEINPGIGLKLFLYPYRQLRTQKVDV